MKVLHINSSVSLRSGVMSFIMNYYRLVCKERVQFDFLYYEDRDNDYKNEIEKLNGAIYKSPKPTKFREFKRFTEKFCDEHRNEYDIIHLHDPYLVLFYVALKRKLNARVLITHAHSTRFSDSFIGGIRNRICSIPNAWIPDFYCACSNKAGQCIFGSKFFKKGFLVPNAIKTSNFNNNRELRSISRLKFGVEDRFVIGHVGNFTRPKNHEFIIDVFAQIVNMRQDALLILVGDGDNKTKIQSKCEALGLSDRVVFLGVRDDVGDVMRSFDRFLFPSLYEGLGIVLIEAQTAGVPCVYSSTVPTETNILKENNRILSLNQPKEEWVKALLDSNLSVQYNMEDTIKNAGYDIECESKSLKLLYQKMIEELN